MPSVGKWKGGFVLAPALPLTQETYARLVFPLVRCPIHLRYKARQGSHPSDLTGQRITGNRYVIYTKYFDYDDDLALIFLFIFKVDIK